MRNFPISLITKLISNRKDIVSDNRIVSSYAIDSRQATPQSLFFALPGERTDGHLHLGEAARRGAIAAVVNSSYNGPSYGMTLIEVNDGLDALHQLARSAIDDKSPPIVAITGSVGKTTTKELLAQILSMEYSVAYSPGNANSQIGLPLTLLNHTSGLEDFWIFEMGMTQTGQIAKLVNLTPPSLAILTTVSLVHAAFFSNLSEIAAAKMEIFSHPKTRHHIFDSSLKLNYPHSTPITFSTTDPNADFFLDKNHAELLLQTPNNQLNLGQFPLQGSHHKHNLLAAVLGAFTLGMDWKAILSAIPHLKLPEKRMQTININGVTFVNDSYNASPISVKAALENLPLPKEGGKRVAVLGEMLELGKFSYSAHNEIGKFALNCVEEVFCFGSETRPIVDYWTKANRFVCDCTSHDEIKDMIRKRVQPGDVVLLKGSHSKQLWKIVDDLSVN